MHVKRNAKATLYCCLSFLGFDDVKVIIGYSKHTSYGLYVYIYIYLYDHKPYSLDL